MSFTRRTWIGPVRVLDGVHQVDCTSITAALSWLPRTDHAVITVGGRVVANVYGRSWRLVPELVGARAQG